ncbi:META domain-containing protein [Halopseudomonas laoshanensis]|uniref:META domain-containing protein n=1 Tax=Halopseudomonas laoshanensis TaxID=2268758 RepID=A0A7V7KWD7_9GAMM|nr:META domain-containing protein [Halopseudomonas laoshanensis]KAA0693853.1 META domain-containing protein [Halopseudomonas laoshanensis]
MTLFPVPSAPAPIRWGVAATVLGALLLLVGCSDAPQEVNAEVDAQPPAEAQTSVVDADDDRMVLRGQLVYRSRVALAPNSQALIELRDVSDSASPDEAMIAEQRFSLNGRQVPLEFALELSASDLSEDGDYQLRAALTEAERTTWISEPISVPAQAGIRDLGQVTLMPYRAAAFSSVLQCGRLQVSAGYEGDTLVLDANGEKHILLPVEAASGARYEAEGDPDTRFWSKGNTADLIIDAVRYPLCVPPGEIIEPFVARGNEPFWRVDLEAGALRLTRLEEELIEAAEYTQAVESTTSRLVSAVAGDSQVEMQVNEALCTDSMSGMLYPQTVELSYDDHNFSGCGGDPLRLIQGVEWVVEDINEAGIIDRSHVTVNFGPDGLLYGQASCNNYRGEYALSGEGLTLSTAATTRKACAPALMQQEQRVLAALASLQRFDFTEDGALILYAGAGQSLTARAP